MATEVAFKVVFGPRLEPIGVEDAYGKLITSTGLSDVKPTVEEIVVPLEILAGSDGASRVCYVHMGCRVFKVPC